MTSPPLPRYLFRADLQGFYGLSRGAIDTYQQRGMLPAPDANCSTGMLWSLETLQAAREQPIADLAAAVPIDTDLGWRDVDEDSVYMCPNRSGHFIGWTTPSILGLVESGNLAQWHRVLACARYDAATVIETSTDDTVVQGKLDIARARRPDTPALTVFLLGDTLATGKIRVSSRSTTAGLQRGRFLARRGNQVGSPHDWLDLPDHPASPPLREFTLPVLDDSYPRR